uniref:Reverse transcriptase zinc-binding domain-containing protein n=1 Tax=Brassica oleracea var. oleracea TaxID=109376 RepID=A0A0D3A3K0_BRAOL
MTNIKIKSDLFTKHPNIYFRWDQAASFLRSEIGNSKTTLFWFDNWLRVGRLLNITGASGTQVLDIPRYATVSEAASGGQWNILRCRGYHLWAMIACINSVLAPAEDAVADRRLWCHRDEDYKPTFSSKATWEQLRVHNPKLPWCKVVWFQQSIPRIDCRHEREVELGVACNRVSSVVNQTKLVTTCYSLALTHLQYGSI